MANQYDESPYVTLRHKLLLRDPNLTVADKFVDDKELEVSNSLRRIPLFFQDGGSGGLFGDEQGRYINKINFLISPIIKKNSFLLEKAIRIVTLMSVLTERHDNQVGGGKDIKHPLYVVLSLIHI